MRAKKLRDLSSSRRYAKDRGLTPGLALRHSPPMPALSASAPPARDRKVRPIEIITAGEAGRISIGEWS
jgi:hypothetical protein